MDAIRRIAGRALAWVRLLGTAFSQALHVVVRGPLMVVFGDSAPDPDETFSAMLGRRAADGLWWARGLAAVVDVLMFGLDGLRWRHCARAAALHAEGG